MSLTSMLDDASSPLRVLLAAELPDVANLRRSYRAQLPAGVEPLRPDPSVRPAWGTLGAAIDHRLRFALSDAPVSRAGSIAAGAKLVGLVGGPFAHALAGAGRDLLHELARIAAVLNPAERSLPIVLPKHEQDLARACYVAALFEEVYRIGQVMPGSSLATFGGDVTLSRLLAQVPEYVVRDMGAVAGLAEAGLREVRRSSLPSQVLAGPTFLGSSDVGGADADWIASDLLVDVKSTVSPNKLALTEAYQLAGYLLLDYDDSHRINAVGFYLSRIGTLVQWSVPEFLATLGARHELRELRDLVRATLAA